ncbi:MAG: hypothetical protein WD688_18020 [Candidatus Binatia bacterium]
MSPERFSRRFGHGPAEAEISIREDAPEEVRAAILSMAEGDLSLSPSVIRGVLCSVLRRIPDRSNWSEYPNIWEECQHLIEDCPWYKVYDFIEALYVYLARSGDPEGAERWQNLINEYFVEAGVGWRLVNGQLESRGPEAFESAVDTARASLEEAGLRTARQEIHEALRDLSRRPDPDLTGAVQHAMAALECTAREVVDDPRATLGEILRRYPDIIPRPLDEALSRMWGVRFGNGPPPARRTDTKPC